jgi:hypothetical protein
VSLPEADRRSLKDFADSLIALDDAALSNLKSEVSGLKQSVVGTEQLFRQIEAEFGLLALDSPPKGALVLDRGGKLVYPGFQFEDRTVKPVIDRLAALAITHNRNSISVLFWLFAPTSYLADEGRPVDYLNSSPDEVARIANESWSVVW